MSDRRTISVGAERQLNELITEWVRGHHRDGGAFTIEAIGAAGAAGRNSLRCGYSVTEAFEAARTAYFAEL